MSVEKIAEKLFWHETREVRVRNRVRTVGYRYECCCGGWESGLHRRRELHAAAMHRHLARLHVAEQVWEALNHGAPEVVAAAGLVCAEPADTRHEGGEK